jgi:hypothetical protein
MVWEDSHGNIFVSRSAKGFISDSSRFAGSALTLITLYGKDCACSLALLLSVKVGPLERLRVGSDGDE